MFQKVSTIENIYQNNSIHWPKSNMFIRLMVKLDRCIYRSKLWYCNKKKTHRNKQLKPKKNNYTQYYNICTINYWKKIAVNRQQRIIYNITKRKHVQTKAVENQLQVVLLNYFHNRFHNNICTPTPSTDAFQYMVNSWS